MSPWKWSKCLYYWENKDEYSDDPEQVNNVRMTEKGGNHETFAAKSATTAIQLQL